MAFLASLALSGCENSQSSQSPKKIPLETESGAITETTVETTLDPQSAWQAAFDEAMDANPYDQWLESAKDDGRMPYEMYAEYLSFWKSEFRYTLQSAAPLFDDADAYRSWRDSMEDWLDASAEALRREMTQMGSQASKLEVIIPHCESVRQKTVDAKKFCYVMETQESPCEPETLTSFAWRWTPDELGTAGESILSDIG